MPLYEYYCESCHGIFELLRPVRQASDAQPCPVCDGMSKRIISQDFTAYTMRKGLPRRIPDRGLYWTVKGQSTEPERGQDATKTVVRQFPTKPSRAAAEKTPGEQPVVVRVREKKRSKAPR